RSTAHILDGHTANPSLRHEIRHLIRRRVCSYAQRISRHDIGSPQLKLLRSTKTREKPHRPRCVKPPQGISWCNPLCSPALAKRQTLSFNGHNEPTFAVVHFSRRTIWQVNLRSIRTRLVNTASDSRHPMDRTSLPVKGTKPKPVV